MTVTFTKEYYLVTLPFDSLAKPAEARDKRKAQREVLKAAGFKTEYRFPLKSKVPVDAIAAKIKDKTGIDMEVCTAFGMSL